MKKTISLVLILAIIVSLLPISFVYATDAVAKFTITADKTSIQSSGEEQTINYTISMSNISVKEPLAISFLVEIPDGLTLNEDSIAVTTIKDVQGKLPAANSFELNPRENKYQYIYASENEMTLNGTQTLVTFSCTTEKNLEAGDYKVTLSDITVAGFDADESYKSLVDEGYFNITPAITSVIVPVTGVSLNTSELSLAAGSTGTLVATVTPTGATNSNVTYTSSNEDVATVSSTGVVTAKSVGTAEITVKTQDGGYTATCSVTVTCAHQNTTKHEAVASTCATAGHEAYVQCDDCGKIISGSNKPLPLADHTYGNLIEQLDPTHTSTELLAGTKAHYQCSVCGKLFDENKNEVTEEDLIIEAPTHEYGDYVSDDVSHWKECACGNIIEKAEHSGGTATCVSKAVCSICGVEYGNIDSSNHANTVVKNKVEATCTDEGYSGDTYCADCDTLISKGTTITALGHSGGTATCVSKAVCSICGVEYGEIDSNNHANTIVKDAIEATTTSEGYTGDTYCADCGKLISKGEVIPVVKEESPENNQEETTQTENTEVTSSTPETTTNATSTTPDTSDTSNIALWISLLAISVISFGVISKCKVKESKKAKHIRK